MKKTLSIIAIVIIAFSCKSKTENTMVKEIKQDLTDTAFKKGETIKIYNCDLIKIDTMTTNYWDTTFLTNYWKDAANNNRMNYSLDAETILIEDSLDNAMITGFRLEADTTKNPKNIFLAKVYVKASLSSNENILDTLYYLFDTDLKNLHREDDPSFQEARMIYDK
ncbi:MAG TPA: hypothetical protein VMU83_07870 [Hanamia sp.]|nr:hypothetical protein [Hanamia sp.]